MKQIFSRIFLASILVACGKQSDKGESTPPLAPSDLYLKIEALMDTDPCGAESKEKCEFVDVKFEARQSDVSQETIMIVDVGMRIPTLALHHKRIRAHYRGVASSTFFEPFAPSASFPSRVRQILHDEFDNRVGLASSKSFQPLARRFSEKYNRIVDGGLKFGHGTAFVNLLAELNPNIEFVIVHLDDKPSDEPICSANTDSGLDEAERYFEANADALVNIARTHNVKWVNYSMGYDGNYFRSEWKSRNCQGADPTEGQLKRFLMAASAIPRKLSAIDGLLFAQAAPYADLDLSSNPQTNYAADCERLPQRLRVGYFNYAEARLSAEQERQRELLSGEMNNAWACADLFVRDGLKSEMVVSETPVYMTVLGFGHGPMNISGASFMTPGGLSHAIYLMREKAIPAASLVSHLRGSQDLPKLISPFADFSFSNSEMDYVNRL